MTKFATFDEYPKPSLVAAETALLTAWPGLHRYHDDLVLVGGLAVKHLTRPGGVLARGAVTMDVDFGISLAADGGMYGTIADDLRGQDFKRDAQGRYVRLVEGLTIYLDLLTEKPSIERGTTVVDRVPVEAFPGIQRALATKTPIPVSGHDAYGVRKTVNVPVSGIGPLLVLKINAFASREQPKDAYDILLSVSNYVGGFAAAITAFQEETNQGNTGYAYAVAALQRHFTADNQSGPLRCAAFAPADAASREQIIQQSVSVGKALLGK